MLDGYQNKKVYSRFMHVTSQTNQSTRHDDIKMTSDLKRALWTIQVIILGVKQSK